MPSRFTSKDMKGFYFYFFAWCVISARIIMEFSVAHMPHRYFLYFHHLFWFYSAFLIYMIFFRYIAGVKADKITQFTLATPIIWTPILVHILSTSSVMRLNYLLHNDLYTSFLHIVSFMFLHPKNYSMAPELISLFVGTLFVSYYLSRSIIKSILTTVASYTTLMLVIATIWIGPDKFKAPIFIFHSIIQPHLFFASYHMINTFMLLFILFAPEIKRYLFPTIFRLKTAITTSALFAIFYGHLIFMVPSLYGKTPTTADMLILFIHPLIYSLFVMAWRTRFWGVRLFMSTITVMSLIVIIPLFIGSHIR